MGMCDRNVNVWITCEYIMHFRRVASEFTSNIYFFSSNRHAVDRLAWHAPLLPRFISRSNQNKRTSDTNSVSSYKGAQPDLIEARDTYKFLLFIFCKSMSSLQTLMVVMSIPSSTACHQCISISKDVLCYHQYFICWHTKSLISCLECTL